MLSQNVIMLNYLAYKKNLVMMQKPNLIFQGSKKQQQQQQLVNNNTLGLLPMGSL